VCVVSESEPGNEGRSGNMVMVSKYGYGYIVVKVDIRLVCWYVGILVMMYASGITHFGEYDRRRSGLAS